MISETAYSSQTKLIGLNLHVSEHGIGYSNLKKKEEKRDLMQTKALGERTRAIINTTCGNSTRSTAVKKKKKIEKEM